MADVKLTIGGRPYDVHCADGEEVQLTQLASIVDEKVRTMPGVTEMRQLLFAALMLADETQEARGKVEKAEPQSDSLRAAVALAESRGRAREGRAEGIGGGAEKYRCPGTFDQRIEQPRAVADCGPHRKPCRESRATPLSERVRPPT